VAIPNPTAPALPGPVVFPLAREYFASDGGSEMGREDA